ncbi:putative cinnamoyl-CoA reductase [Aspergillus steynii IBT 23096]|uniref:Putative cinnamoyl-CoA reductase n=1 Tax=Aspergillus steynii IBT 23096 TaxID=1392250 RepID=A0A2I2GME5_9EURO|nr:putative cinnamoyl-CoA reductase [Aspergillus steynii IBT 23096]PLB54046.1 putative cinnamoyl-CoA reductase [Aspergillus steynii IBT 23096]
MPHGNHALPVGSRVLVTGANGYIATQVVEQLLLLGYVVRGTVRASKPWLDEYFHAKYGADAFEPVIVSSFSNRDEIDRALDGVDGIVHAASDVSLNTDPAQVIPWVVRATLDVLELAAQRPAIKRVVLVSSSTALYSIHPLTYAKDTWNDRSVRLAWDPESSGDTKNAEIYSASKTEGERQSYKWMEEHKPQFVLNSVLPAYTFGKVLSPEMFGSTMGYTRGALKGDSRFISAFPQHWFVDVEDIARLCVVGLLDPSVQAERIFGFAENLSGRDIISILQKLRPNNPHITLPAENVIRDRTEVLPRKRAEDLLRRFYGQTGWTSIRDSLEKGIEGWE